MKRLHILRPFLVVALLLPLLDSRTALSGPAQPDQGPVVARVTYAGQTDLAYLAARLDIWEVDPEAGFLVALLSPQTHAELIREGFSVQVDRARTAEVLNRPLEAQVETAAGVPTLPCYRTVEETERGLKDLAAAYPGLARVVDIGDSWEKIASGGTSGYDLYTLILTNQSLPGPKPRFFLIGAVHAREMATAETALRFAEDLAAAYGQDPDVTWLLDTAELHVLPMANPDGRKIAEQGWYWRKNTDNDDGCTDPFAWGVDLNRNSSFRWGGDGSDSFVCGETYRGPEPASEPEVVAIQTYAASIFPDQRGPGDLDAAPETAEGLLVSLHSYGSLVLWPWGWTPDPAPNAVGLETLGSKLAFFNGYIPEQAYSLYPTNGTTDDWVYGELGVAAYTFEMGNRFFQDCAAFESRVYPDNRRALLYAFKAARQPYLEPGGPEITSLDFSTAAVLAGEPLTVTANIDDTRFQSPVARAGQPIQSARLATAPPWQAVDFQDLAPLDGAWDSPVEMSVATIDTAGWLPGRHTLFADAEDVSGSRGVPTAGFVCIAEAAAALSVVSDPPERELYPGESETFTVTLTNRGVTTETYGLDWEPKTWEVVGAGLMKTLAPCEQAQVPLLVRAPLNVPPEDRSPLVLYFRFLSDPEAAVQVALAGVTTSPLSAKILPGGLQEGALPGLPVSYQPLVTNHGTVSETLQVAASLNDWALTAPRSLTLAAGETITVPLTVEPPASAFPGEFDTVRIELYRTGEEPPLLGFTLITRVGWSRFLPLIR